MHPMSLSNIISDRIVSSQRGRARPEAGRGEKNHYSCGWSFYFGRLSFSLAEVIGVLAVNIYIERSRRRPCQSRSDLLKAGGARAAPFCETWSPIFPAHVAISRAQGGPLCPHLLNAHGSVRQRELPTRMIVSVLGSTLQEALQGACDEMNEPDECMDVSDM
ncbi:Voltage-Dependent Calcium Channel Gamma-8 Subunit [Manis pentadactyla]|nr:Voltage-Dependent Calcium Channel Gamma-8 Subunit [Manis pentadactyla]